VVSALTALPDLEQLTWSRVKCGQQRALTDSMLLQKLTKITALTLDYAVAADVFKQVGLLPRLQDLSLDDYCLVGDWTAAGCPGLQELKALTRLRMPECSHDIPATLSQLTALQHLDVGKATPTALSKLWPLTHLTHLSVRDFSNLSPQSPPLQLAGLQKFMASIGDDAEEKAIMPMSFLASCTQLRVLKLSRINLSGPGSLVASTMLQRLDLWNCRISAADADAASWQQVFPSPAQLPHLASLSLMDNSDPELQQADIECVVACCSSLHVLHLGIPFSQLHPLFTDASVTPHQLDPSASQ